MAESADAGSSPDTAPDTAPKPTPETTPETTVDWRRRRRLAEVFGETMPDTTADEREPGEGRGATGPRDAGRGDTWLREQVPPHHGTP